MRHRHTILDFIATATPISISEDDKDGKWPFVPVRGIVGRISGTFRQIHFELASISSLGDRS